MNDDFYIGYDTPVPARSRGLIYATVAAAIGLGLLVVALVLGSERPFAASSFAFGDPHQVSGRLVSNPYPTLELDAAAATDANRRVLLVAPGKHGAADLVAPFANQHVRLSGSLISRGSRRAIEIEPGTIARLDDSTSPTTSTERDLGTFTLRGEIVDGKCYLGVMNPGEGATHRDCAVTCIRGGLPPLFAVPTGDGVFVFTLESSERQPVNAQVADLVGRPVEISGHVLASSGELLLLADPSSIHLLPAR